MNGLDFLEFLRTRGVLDDARASRIRSKLVKPGSKPVSAERLAKYLVEKSELPQNEAVRYLREFTASAAVEVVPLMEADEIVDLAGVSNLEVFDDGGSQLVPLGSGDPFGQTQSAPKAEPERTAGSYRAKEVLANRWESKWMIIGPTLIILLSIIAGFLYFVLVRRGSEELFDSAMRSYRAQSYPEAIEQFDEYVYFYEDTPKASEARVRIRLAHIRRFADSKQWDKALDELPTQLNEIEEEEWFGDEARAELETLLPNIARGLIESAESAANVDEKSVRLQRSQKAMEFVNNSSYIPGSVRRRIESNLNELTSRYAQVERSILRERKLVDTIAGMDQAITQKQTIAAFEARKSLLREFPDLIAEPRLLEASERVANAEANLVTPIAEPIPPAAVADANDSQGTITLATRVGSSVTELAGEVHPVLARGSVYMIDVSNGQVLWRRFVGYETNIQPEWVNGSGSDVIVASQRDLEVLRIESRTGNVVWRASVGRPFASVTVASNGVLVSTRDGHVLRIALDAMDGIAAGTVVEGVQIPQPLSVGPAADRSGRYLYQPGLEANLYVLESEEGSDKMVCREVYYLGHAKGSVVVPPVLVQGLLFIVENSGLDYSNLHILKPTQRGLGLEPAQAPIRLRGEVLAAAEIYGPQGLVVLTDRGETRIFQVDPTVEDEPPVSPGPGFDRQTPPGTYSYYVANKGKLWVGDTGLRVMSIQIQRGRIEPLQTLFPGNRYLGPPAVYGSVMIQTRQRAGSELVTVSAHNTDTMDEIWSTNFGAPLAGGPHREVDGSMVLVTSEGDQYVLDEGLIDTQVGTEPRRRGSNTEIDLVFRWKVDFGQGRVICFGPPEKKRVLAIDPSQRVNTAPISDLGLPEGTLAFPPVRFGEFVLAGSSQGPLFLLDPLRAQGQGVPFQPPTGPEQTVTWARPCVIDETQFVIGDERGNVYRIRRDGRNLAKDAEAVLEGRLVTPLANSGQRVFVGAMQGNNTILVHFLASDLDSSEAVPFTAPINFGPFSLQGIVLVGTADGVLHAFGDQGQELWTLPIDSAVVGVGISASASELFVATTAGAVLVVGAADGKVQTMLNAGEPLDGAPFIEAGRLFAPAFDGSIRVLAKP